MQNTPIGEEVLRESANELSSQEITSAKKAGISVHLFTYTATGQPQSILPAVGGVPLVSERTVS
jgi:hypothetical protein